MDDQISRQMAIKIIKNYCENGCDIAEDNWCPSCQREQFIKLLEALSPAQPRMKGKWVKAERRGCITYSDAYAECSYCHGEPTYLGWGMNFCPNCGASMSEGEKDGDEQWKNA